MYDIKNQDHCHHKYFCTDGFGHLYDERDFSRTADLGTDMGNTHDLFFILYKDGTKTLQ